MRTSVVITAYNLERFIGDAVRSALEQTRKPDEIIVVNDCSTDATRARLAEFGDAITVIDQPVNKGALRAALLGLSKSKGEVVAFLDGDDLWMPTKLEKCLALFEAHPTMTVVSHQHRRVDADGRPLGIRDDTHENIDSIVRRTSDPLERSELFKRSILEKRGYWLGSAYCVRRSAVDLPAFQAWVDALPHPEDVYLDLVLAPFVVLHHPNSMVGLVDESLFDYRIHANNSCNDYRDVERALRSVRRAYNTTLAANDLNLRFPDLQIARDGAKRHEGVLDQYRFLLALYNDHRVESLTRFAKLTAQGVLKGRPLARETARLASVLVGGPQLFLKLKDRAQSTAEQLREIRRSLGLLS